MSDPSFNSVTIRQPTAGASADLLTVDSVDGADGNGASLRFINNSAGALSLTIARLSALRVDPGTVRLDLAVAADPSLSSGDATPALLSLVKGPGAPSVSTAAGSTLSIGGSLSVTGVATFGGGLSVTGDLSLNGRGLVADGVALDAHLASTANPHGTTAAQIGALATTGGSISGGLDIQGRLGVGLTSPGFALDVADRARVRQGPAGTAGIWFFQSGPADDRAFVGMASDTSVGFWGNTGAGWGLTMDTGSGNVTLKNDLALGGDLTLKGVLRVPNTGDKLVSFSNATFSNESSFQKNNLKLIMGSSRLVRPGVVTRATEAPLGARRAAGDLIDDELTATLPIAATVRAEYEFAIGHTSSTILNFPHAGVTTFRKVFSVNENGDAFFAGGKTGYVVDHFVNRVGEPLEQGDVVVISQHQSTYFLGADNNIPLPEVDLSDQAYDRRVCGIVARAVAQHELPLVEPPDEDGPPTEGDEASYVHPLSGLAAGPDYERTRVGDQQLGTMVTLGAFAHCKVDADIAPITVGDLLTTSPTRGHAQKVLEPERCAGAIVGKALAALEAGKGKIPVIVMLQ